MADEINRTEPEPAPAKKGRARQTRKPRVGQTPVTRSQAVAWGALGLTLGNALTLAVAKLLGVH